MKVLSLKAAGPVGNFELTDLAQPSVTDGHLLIEVHACSVNQIDIKIRQGLPIGPVLPSAIGCDMAGVVIEVGANVKGFKAGDEVYGCVAGVKGLGGTMSEYIVADAKLVAHKPKNIGMKQAASLPLVAITAWEGIARSQLAKGEQILVHGGMGGVGHIAIQLAASLGAIVSTTVHKTRDDGFLKSIGVSNIIDAGTTSVDEYKKTATQNNGFDAVFDTVGGTNLDKSFEAIGLNGRVVAIAARSTHDLSPLHAKGAALQVVFMLLPMLFGNGREQHGKILSELTTLVEAGKVKPLVDDKDFSLQEGGAAHAYLESGQAVGKVVISVR
ncbi:zinc-binding dehydrogenase [Alcaligenaceae bacterium]|nr:zinc-binding dehydrogenase [Alcaligenaceae bacterium]